MGSDVKSLPIIDVAPLLGKCDDPNMAEDEEVLKVVRQLDEACKETGFFYVKGHGIPDSLIKEARDVTQEFFALPTEKKHTLRLSATTGYRGYQILGGNLTNGTPDFHEAINSYREIGPGEYGSLGKPLQGPNIWPDTPANFKPVLEQYTSLLKEVGRKIMRGLALALGAPADAFEGEIAGDAFWLHRLIGYPSLSDTKSTEMKCNDFGCGAHTDIGSLVTFLNQTEDIHALQMRKRSGDWVTAIPIPGTFVCIIGEMLKILTNGIYEPTLHTVFNNSPKYRVSLAFFYEPTFDKLIEPLDFFVQKTGGIAKYKGSVRGQTLGDHVVKNLIHRDQ